MRYQADIGRNWVLWWAGVIGFMAMALLLFILSRNSARAFDAGQPHEHVLLERSQEPQDVELLTPRGNGQLEVGEGSTRVRIGPGQYVFVYSS